MHILPRDVLVALERVVADLQEVGRDIKPESLRDAARYYIEKPGKMLRPILLLTFSYSLDRRSLMDPRVLQVATIVELLHIVSLLQDDVMDKHDERRGAKTPRVIYGDERTVLASDWLIAESIKRAVKLGEEVVEYLADVAQRLSMGQALDLEGEREKAAELKTAPLIEATLVLPALLLKRRDVLELAKRLGASLGVLYQYSDDMSDEGERRDKTAEVTAEVKNVLAKMREVIGEAFTPFENLVNEILKRALQASLTVARSFIP
ncbi:polyprenyl synthetase family protein [Pyrobaculum sp.]|uniref:polyprenyl synthetase family protein n=1 Tax=Pyrobaculum sp. TaxID=2004705 RepID=UPI00316A8771